MTTIRQHLETYAVTILTHQRHLIFQRSANAERMIASLFRYRDQDRFTVHAFVQRCSLVRDHQTSVQKAGAE